MTYNTVMLLFQLYVMGIAVWLMYFYTKLAYFDNGFLFNIIVGGAVTICVIFAWPLMLVSLIVARMMGIRN